MKDLVISEFKTASIATVTVSSPKGGEITFDFNIHSHDSAETLLLDPESFYSKGNGLSYPHWEIEIVNPSKEVLSSGPTHFHEGKEGKAFICWAHHTPTLEAATKIFEGWVGAAYLAIRYGIDANLTVGKYCGAGADRTFLAGLYEGLQRDHGIKVDFMVMK